MKKLLGALLVLVLALWLFSGLHSQQSVGGDESTVQAQLTVVAGPTPSPSP